MIKIEHLYKKFNATPVLKDISVTFIQGKTNLIIGESGSGKTILLKSIIGLHSIDSGSIFYQDSDFVAMSVKQKQALRREMGVLFQGGALFDSLTVEENIKFPLDMFTNMTTKEKIERVNFCLDKVKLHKVNSLLPAELSGGMQKRVAIARAIVQNPKYLFCDEPNSGLDPKTAIIIDNLISDITHEFNITSIINTHDMNSVLEIGEKVVFIHDGEISWEGNKDGILNSNDSYLNDFVFASNLAKRIKEKI